MSETTRWLHSMGVCVRCRQRDAYTMNGRWYCAECTAKRNRKKRADYAANRERENERLRRFRRDHKNSGLCIRCNNKAVEGKTLCEKHLREQKKYARDYNDRTHLNGKKTMQFAICLWCDEPVEPGFRCCARHHEIFKENIRKMNEKRDKAAKENHQWRRENAVMYEGVRNRAAEKRAKEQRSAGNRRKDGSKESGNEETDR